MDLPRAVVLGAPFAGAAAAGAALSLSPQPASALLLAGLALGLALGAYATLRLRGDLAPALGGVALGLALVFRGMYTRCRGEACAALDPVWTGAHVGAFAAALAVVSLVAAAPFAKALRIGWPRTLLAIGLAALAFVVDVTGWVERAGAEAALP
ncbi:MAG TPA: hypothetical protein VI997_05185 [Candidatus Thermoplasmatota archaeon]|nr:hypothetical protein [Candidatus Thermoplasmatota archaeon]